MKANWVVWPLANFVAFRFLHQDVRILYANIIGVSPLLCPLLPCCCDARFPVPKTEACWRTPLMQSASP